MDPHKIDDSERKQFENVWSRLIPALGEGGHETLKKLQTSSVLVVGLKGLGIEIAKNLVLMGIQGLSLFDDEPVAIADLSANFFLTEQDIGTKRADACLKKLTELNERVRMQVLPALTEENLLQHKVVVLTNAQSLEEMLQISDTCHAHKIGFIAADILGLFGYVFVDLGEEWVVTEKNGEPPKRGFIESITQDETGLVTLWDEKLHDLQDGDTVKFTGVEGMEELNDKEFTITVKSPFQFAIGDTSKFGNCVKGGTFIEVKKPFTLQYKTLRAMLAEKPKIFTPKSDTAVTVDWSKALLAGQYHLTIQALFAFRAKHSGRLPSPSNKDEAKEVAELAKEINTSKEETEKVDEVDEKTISLIAEVSQGEISPMAAFFGGLVGQEVIKASTGKFTPIYQWFFFDALDVLQDERPPASDFELKGTRYDGQIAVFGHAFQEQIKKLNYFLVGAGAIGCEMLKNWAMMGIGCGDGQIQLTDIDTIEISNLNRQFLFRENDISKPKSQVAAAAVKQMNPEVNVKTWIVKVAPDTEDTFNEKFWKGLDAVTTALDNVEARKYLDSRCVFYGKPMIDSGTQGTKGHVQVVIPGLTESYSASSDPPQPTTPVCLLHQFPHTIEHCMQWAREVLFEGYFVKDAEIVNNWIENENYIKSLQPVTQLSALRTLETCILSKPKNLDDCVIWARHAFEKWYDHAIRRLLDMYPLDHKDDNGSPFWVGGKLPPTITNFDSSNEMHVTFLSAAAFLRAYTFGLIEEEFRPDNLSEQIEKMKELVQTTFKPEPYQAYSNKALNKTDKKGKEDEAPLEEAKAPEEMDKEKESITSRLPDRASFGSWRMRPIKFEKDDDRNFHVDFIWAAANIRASEYKIKTVERLESKLIAGNIIPAIVTTTSLVTGLVCLELYKVMQKKPFAAYRNAFINLANCILQSAEPIAPSKKKFADKEWTEWDFIDVKRGDITLATFLKFMKARHNIDVDSVMYGAHAIYLDFMNRQKVAERMPKPLSALVSEVSGRPLAAGSTVFKVHVTAEDEKGEEIKFIPSIRVWYKTKPKQQKAKGEKGVKKARIEKKGDN